MKKKNHLLFLFLILSATALGTANPADAQKSASSTAVKIGYFNLDMVKAAYPASAESETLKAQAEAQLRKDVDDANKALQKMQMDKRSNEEIQKATHDTQISIDAEQATLYKLLQRQNTVVKERIFQAANKVAKDKGLDLVIDGAGIFAGGKMVLDNGVDVTREIARLLTPQTVTGSGAGASGGAGGSGASTSSSSSTSTSAGAAKKTTSQVAP